MAHEVDDFEGTEVNADLSTVTAMTRGEVDSQVVTAKRYPRSVSTFMKRAQEMVCLNAEIAESCMYALPRGGKTIEGPSARFAEIIASAWTNMRIKAQPIDEGERFVTSLGTSWDIETNVAVGFEVKRRITNRNGQRFDDDMVGVTMNAAGSIALRNAVLKNIPKAFWGPIYNAARKVAVGDASTLAERRAQMLAYFLKLGVPNEKVFALLKVGGIEDVTLDHLAVLKGMATAIREGDTTVDQAFSDAAIADGPREPQRKATNGEHQANGRTDGPETKAEHPPAETKSKKDEPKTKDKKSTKPKASEPQPAGPPSNGGAAEDGPTVTTANLIVTNTEVVAPKGAAQYYEITTRVKAEGEPPVGFIFQTPDEGLYERAKSCEGTDTLLTATWHGGKRLDGSRCKVLEKLEAQD